MNRIVIKILNLFSKLTFNSILKQIHTFQQLPVGPFFHPPPHHNLNLNILIGSRNRKSTVKRGITVFHRSFAVWIIAGLGGILPILSSGKKMLPNGWDYFTHFEFREENVTQRMRLFYPFWVRGRKCYPMYLVVIIFRVWEFWQIQIWKYSTS